MQNSAKCQSIRNKNERGECENGRKQRHEKNGFQNQVPDHMEGYGKVPLAVLPADPRNPVLRNLLVRAHGGAEDRVHGL